MATRPTRAASRSRSQQPEQPPAPKPRPVRAAKPAAPKPSRQPFTNTANSPERKTPLPLPPHPVKKEASRKNIPLDSDREPIKAYLRIRPCTHDSADAASPYLETLSDTTVHMSNPAAADPTAGYSRVSAVVAPTTYTFTRVFPPATQQDAFFVRTTLPLVEGVLTQGENGLLFAYGVTNSGKTYTVQGAPGQGRAGILPRTLDVIFNSIEGLQGDAKFRPIRLQGIEAASPADLSRSLPSTDPALATLLPSPASETFDLSADPDTTRINVDRNYSYTIWLSYAEVYNEKVYDLLASTSDADPSHDVASRLPRPAGAPPAPHPLLLKRKALALKPSPLTDAGDDGEGKTAGKYVAGLKQVQVRNAQEAKALVRTGMMHRRVFGTLANAQSSRSHGVVTIKVLRQHRGERDDAAAIQTARLTIVDLAGSERTKHTQTSGERLREAGNINKSLMVLGQCMEVMRANQRRLGMSLAGGGRSDTRDVKRTLAVVPFRHSRLTEMLMDYFVGDARAVMIVNVNPYDTGFEETSHVMKFAAVAREVQTVAAPAPVQRVPAPPSKLGRPASPSKKAIGPSSLGLGSAPVPARKAVVKSRKVTIESARGGASAVLEVLEEDEEPDEGDEDEDDMENPFIDALFEEIESLRMQLFESQMRCAIVEAETHEEVTREWEERMMQQERLFRQRLERMLEQQESKADAKIEMLHNAGLITGAGRRLEEVEEEADVEMSLMVDEDEEEGDAPHQPDYDAGPEAFDFGGEEDYRERSPSPLVAKGKQRMSMDELVPYSPSGQQPWQIPVPQPAPAADHDSDDDMYVDPDPPAIQKEPSPPATESEGSSSAASGSGSNWSSSSGSHKRQRSTMDELGSLELPPLEDAAPAKAKKSRASRARGSDTDDEYVAPLKKARARAVSHKKTASKKSVQVEEVIEIKDDDDDDDDAVVIPNKEARQEALVNCGPDVEYVPRKGEPETAKKKKRQLGKKPVLNEEQIARMAALDDADAGKPVRRATRASRR